MCLRQNLIAFNLILLLSCPVACQTGGESVGLPDGDPKLAFRLVEKEGALLLDVRTPEEYAQARIPGAKNIQIDQLAARLKEVTSLVGGKKDHPIVVYCARGGRAARAKQILLEAGFCQITNLGGLSDWPQSVP